MYRQPSRSDDNLLLVMVEARCLGWGASKIAQLFGVAPSVVRVSTNRVRAADIKESGEPVKFVGGAYW